MTTDHDATTCGHDWCQTPSHRRMCTCAYTDQFPHPRAGCRYARDDQGDSAITAHDGVAQRDE